MKIITFVFLLLTSILTAQVPEDWEKYQSITDSCYLLVLPTSNGVYYFGVQEQRMMNELKMQFWYNEDQFLFFPSRKSIKIKVRIKKQKIEE